MPSSHSRLPLSAGLLVLLGGCVTPPPPAPPPAPEPVVCAAPPPEATAPATPSGDETDGPRTRGTQRQAEGSLALLAFADRVRSMTPNELSAEISRLSDTPDAVRGPFGDLQLAVALVQTRSPPDAVRAQGLLQRLSTNGSEDARRLQPLGRLLASRYAEQRRVEDQLDRQNQQLRDSQRRIDQLNERLEAVRAIERSLTRSSANGAAAATPPPPPPAPAAAPKP